MALRSPAAIAGPPAAPPVGRHRHRLGLAMVVTGGIIVLAGVWLAVTGLLARGHLERARADLPLLRAQVAAGDLTGAQAVAADFAHHAGRAHGLTKGPVWALAARVPAGGEPLRTVRGVTAAIDGLGRTALPDLMAASKGLDPASLRQADGSFDLTRIAVVGPALTRASAAMTQAVAGLQTLPLRTWLSSVDVARTDVVTQLTSVAASARSAERAARIVPPLLGEDGPKTYFVAFQNNAEARGTGGLPGAFGIARADHGKVTVERFESDSVLSGVAAKVSFGNDYDQLYGGTASTTLYGNGNISPHFPYAAQIWASMWQKHSGQKVDGVIALDPEALSYLLAVSGPATLPDGSQVSAANVVPLTQSTAYARFPTDNDGRKRYLLDIARAAAQKVIAAGSNPVALVKAGAQAAGERRLLVWSADKAVQAELEGTSVGGAVPTARTPYAGLSIVNVGGNKLDYYLDRKLTWKSTGCAATRDVTVTIALTNNAPRNPGPAIVVSRSDEHPYKVKPGDNRLLVGYLATAGAQLTSVTLDGKAGGATVGRERGHSVFNVDLELPRGTTRTVVLHLKEPGTGPPVVLRQPLVRPLTVDIVNAACG